MRTLLLAVLGMMLTLFWPSAQAEFALALDDPTTQGVDIVVEDNGPGDLNVLSGIITYCPPRSDLEACITGYSKDRRGTLEVMPGIGHFPQLENPQWISERLIRWVKKHSV